MHGEEVFLANYADGLTDFPLPSMIDHFMASGKVAAFLCVQPTHSFHMVSLGEGHDVTGIQHLSRSGLYVNGGYFIFRKEIFNYIRDGEELVEEPFHRLVEEGLLAGYRHDGFWLPMDTFKDKQLLEDMYSRGVAPWEVWKNGGQLSSRCPRRPWRSPGTRTTIRSGCSDRAASASPSCAIASPHVEHRAATERAARRCRSCVSARIPTTSRSGAAAPC